MSDDYDDSKSWQSTLKQLKWYHIKVLSSLWDWRLPPNCSFLFLISKYILPWPNLCMIQLYLVTVFFPFDQRTITLWFPSEAKTVKTVWTMQIVSATIVATLQLHLKIADYGKSMAYHLHLGCKAGNWDKSQAPPYCCITCATYLRHWLNEKKKSQTVSLVQKEPTNGCDCYYYMVLPIKTLI